MSMSRANHGKTPIRRLNFLDAGAEQKLTISPDSIPTLVPDEIMNKWMAGDEQPYYKLQKIDYPIVANHLTYEESFFESFIGKLNQRPIPGSKAGHDMFFGSRPPTDFLLVGGKMEKNGDGSGTVYFKNYIPPTGESGDNTIFRRENDSNMVHYSLVTYPKEIIERNEDGYTKIRIVESLMGERNDAVEYGTGAMKQVTNTAADVAEDDETDDNSAVGAEKITNEEIHGMDKQELLKRINTLMANGDLKLLEIAESVGKVDLLMTDAAKNAVEFQAKMNALGVKTPDDVEALQKKIADGETQRRENELTAAFGPAKLGEKDNYVRQYANNLYNGEMTIDQLRADPIIKKLMAEQADVYSEHNILGYHDGGKPAGDQDSDQPQIVAY